MKQDQNLLKVLPILLKADREWEGDPVRLKPAFGWISCETALVNLLRYKGYDITEAELPLFSLKKLIDVIRCSAGEDSLSWRYTIYSSIRHLDNEETGC